MVFLVTHLENQTSHEHQHEISIANILLNTTETLVLVIEFNLL